MNNCILLIIVFNCINLLSQNKQLYYSKINIHSSSALYSLSTMDSGRYKKDNSQNFGFAYTEVLGKNWSNTLGMQYCRTEYNRNANNSCLTCADRYSNVYLNFYLQSGWMVFKTNKLISSANIGFATGWLLKPKYFIDRNTFGPFERNIRNAMVGMNFLYKITDRFFIETEIGARYFLTGIERIDEQKKPSYLYYNYGISYRIR